MPIPNFDIDEVIARQQIQQFRPPDKYPPALKRPETCSPVFLFGGI